MSAETLHKIQISVKTWFREDLSNLDEGSFFFNYEITIHNAGDVEVQLLRRYWRVDHLTLGSIRTSSRKQLLQCLFLALP
ncbi:MAG: ApaG domain [Flavobacteriales bacterium]|nr:ApaG domain [Flavobacteriales bacterium]